MWWHLNSISSQKCILSCFSWPGGCTSSCPTDAVSAKVKPEDYKCNLVLLSIDKWYHEESPDDKMWDNLYSKQPRVWTTDDPGALCLIVNLIQKFLSWSSRPLRSFSVAYLRNHLSLLDHDLPRKLCSMQKLLLMIPWMKLGRVPSFWVADPLLLSTP